MSEVAVVIAPQIVANAIADQLADWSAAGVVRPVIVVDEARVGANAVMCRVISDGVSRACEMFGYLADMSTISRVRLCAVSTVREKAVMSRRERAQLLERRIGDALPRSTKSMIQLIAQTRGAAPWPEHSVWAGWHNLVIAPVDAMAPGGAVQPLESGTSRGLLDAHLMTALCTIAGLWSHATGSPVDDLRELPSEQVRLLQCYSRLLNAEAVEDAMVSGVASVSDGYPLPMNGSEKTVRAENPLLAIRQMTDRFFDKHPELECTPPPTPREATVEEIRPWAALKMLWGFLWSALMRQPGAWATAKVAEAKRRIAITVQETVFGKGDSEYVVVVDGVRADGRFASWDEIEAAATGLADRVGAPEGQQSDSDLSSAWEDLARGAFTLLDAGARADELPPIAVGRQRAVVTDVNQVAPAASRGFLPTANLGDLEFRRIAPADMVGAGDLRAVLQAADSGNTQVSQQRAALDDWQHWASGTYVGSVGEKLGKQITKARQQVDSILSQLDKLKRDARNSPDEDAAQRHLATTMLAILAVAVAICLCVALGAGVGAVPVLMALGIGAVVGLGWLVSSVVVFTRGQTRLHHLLHELDDLPDRVKDLEHQLRIAMADLRRLVRAYRQFIDWSKVLGCFLGAPRGVLSQRVPHKILLGAGHPRCVRFGEAEPQSQAMDEAVARLRRQIFTAGWLDENWKALLSRPPQSLGPLAYELREDAALLWKDPGVGKHSVLSKWSAAVCSVEREDSGHDLRLRVGSEIPHLSEELRARVLAGIRQLGTAGRVERMDHRRFIEGLTTRDDNQRFAVDLFSQQALSRPNDVTAVETPWSPSEANASFLGGSAVVALLSGGLTEHDLNLT